MHTSVRRAMTAILAALSLGLTAAACGSSSSGPTKEPSLVAGASPGGSLRIGISFTNPGLGFKDGDTYTGFDVETATYVAKALGVDADHITWVEAKPADREKLLQDGKVDLIFATYSITDDRKKVVDFAGPYFVAHQDLLVRRNDTEITGPDTLHKKVLCSVPGTTSSAYITDHYKGDIKLEEFDTYGDCVEALLDGKVDAVTTDDIILAGFASESKYKGKLKLVGDGFTDEEYGVGIPKGDTKRVEQVNAALKQYIADGSWKKALEATVTPSGYDLPDAPTPGS